MRPNKALIILCGLPGSGKSTVAQAIADLDLGFTPIVSSDAIRLRFFPNPKYSPWETGEVFTRFHGDIIKHLQDDNPLVRQVIADATNLRMRNVEPLLAIASVNNATPFVFLIEAPESVRAQRILKRTYPEPHGTLAASKKMERYEDLDPEIISGWLDGTAPPEQLADRVLRVIES